jgi:hypothetical protein
MGGKAQIVVGRGGTGQKGKGESGRCAGGVLLARK